jgi:hypothetical protein
MSLIGDKIQEKIDYGNAQRYGDIIGMITAYDHTSNTASIVFQNPNGGGSMTADNVGVKLTEGGAAPAAPHERQKCIITFLGDNILNPLVTSLFTDEYYEDVYAKRTNTDEGAFIVDQFINDIVIPAKTTPMVEDWIDKVNDHPEKYNTNFKDYSNIDAVRETLFELMQIDKYRKTEDGITNIKTKATVKCKDNGDIDIFVENNTGIRINPNTKSITLFGMNIASIAQEWNIKAKNVVIDGNLTIRGQLKFEEVQ